MKSSAFIAAHHAPHVTAASAFALALHLISLSRSIISSINMSANKIQTKTLSDIPSKFPLIQGKEMGKVCVYHAPLCAMRLWAAQHTCKKVGNTNKSQKISFSTSTEIRDLSNQSSFQSTNPFVLSPHIQMHLHEFGVGSDGVKRSCCKMEVSRSKTKRSGFCCSLFETTDDVLLFRQIALHCLWSKTI